MKLKPWQWIGIALAALLLGGFLKGFAKGFVEGLKK
jgi:hypothetical protein